MKPTKLRSCLEFISSLVKSYFRVDLSSLGTANSGLFARTKRIKMPERILNKQKSQIKYILAVNSKQLLTTLALAVAVMLGACTKESKTWNEVEYLHSTADAITITGVEFTDTATILSIHEKNTPGWWIKIPESTRLVGNKGKEYKIIGGDGIVVGEQFVTPESGEAHFKLLFEPMPRSTRHFDYVESYSLKGWRIYGLHHPSQPIEIPRYKTRLTQEEMAEGFLRTDTVHIYGKIENYSRDKGFSTIQIHSENTLTREDSPISINVNEDGTFAASYVCAYPRFEIMSIQGNGIWKAIYIYVAPDCTTELFIGKDWEVNMISPDDKVMLCKHMVDKNVFEPQFCSIMERTDSMKTLDLKAYISFLDRKRATYNRLADYMAWQYDFTPTERYYMQLNSKLEYLYNLFEYDSSSKNAEGYTEYDSLALEYDTYHCLHDMPYNDVACLALRNFYYAINRYEYSPIIQKDIFKPRLQGLDYVTCQDTTRITNDMKVLGASEPTLWGSIILLRDTQSSLEYFRNYYRDKQKQFVEMRRELLTHPFLKAELDRLYAQELEAQKPTWTLPEGEATDILRRMTDKYRGKYLLIDFWGMGCGPCRAGIERSKEMREAFRDHPDVDFLFISDPPSSQEAYDAFVKENLDGEDCQIVSRDDFNKLMQLFKFLGIPHYETLDPDGNVLNKGLEYSTIEAFTKQLEELREQQ